MSCDDDRLGLWQKWQDGILEAILAAEAAGIGCGKRIGIYPCCSVVQGDCLELMKHLPDGCVDAVITDPQYGVGLGDDGPTAIGKTSYIQTPDTPEYVASVCVPAIETCIAKFGRVVLTPGTRSCFMYPPPSEIGTIYNPAGAGFSRWGFTCSQPILFYGKDPQPTKMPQSVYSVELCEKNGHPCPKPIRLMKWMVMRASLEDETVLDPFCGSGTTLVAAKKLGRHFLGFDVSEDYCRIARERLAAIDRQPSLFEQKPEQLGLIPEAEATASTSRARVRDNGDRPQPDLSEGEPVASLQSSESGGCDAPR